MSRWAFVPGWRSRLAMLAWGVSLGLALGTGAHWTWIALMGLGSFCAVANPGTDDGANR